MRRIAIINQKGGVGKTTTTANLGAALAEQGRRVVLVDMDAQANLSLSLGVEAADGSPTSYSVLLGEHEFAAAVRPTAVPGLALVASHIDLSGAELELASQIGREYLLRDALQQWEQAARAATGKPPADYVLFDCPPSLGLLSINALAASGEVLITLQTEFLALQGMSKLVGVVQLLRKRLNPELVVTGILPCLYESRLRLAREVLGEIRKYFPGQVLPVPIRANVKLAEAPSFGQTIFQYAPESIGAMDYRCAARELLRKEARDPDLAGLPGFREEVLKGTSYMELPAPVERPAPPGPPAAPVAAKAEPAAPAPKPKVSKPRRSKSVAPQTSPALPVAAAPPTKRAKRAPPAPPTPEVVLTPAPAPQPKRAAKPVAPAAPVARGAKRRAAAANPAAAEARVLRADELPPLPPDAFEILSSFGIDP